MRKLIVSNIVSLDGYCEGPGKNVMALPMDASFDATNVERLRSASTLLLGATTFRMFSGFWPSVADNPAMSDANREISRRNGAIAKVVVSDSLTPDTVAAPWRTTSSIVKRAQAHAHVAALKREESGGDILVFGSRTLWNDLLGAGLVDEVHLMIGAVTLGGGTPAFASPTSLERIGEPRTFTGSHNVLVKYATR